MSLIEFDISVKSLAESSETLVNQFNSEFGNVSIKLIYNPKV